MRKSSQKCETSHRYGQERNLSLCGKVTVINTLIASLYVYKMQCLPSPTEDHIKQVERIIEDFLWNGHKPKISLATLQNTPQEGGLKLVNLRTKNSSLKAAWVKTLMTNQYNQKLVYNILDIGPIDSMIWCCNMRAEDVSKVIKTENQFWKEVVQAWCEYHYTPSDQINGDQIIWFNSDIRVDGKPICWKKYMSDLTYVSDLICDDRYISYEIAKEKYGLSIMEYKQPKDSNPATDKSKQ